MARAPISVSSLLNPNDVVEGRPDTLGPAATQGQGQRSFPTRTLVVLRIGFHVCQIIMLVVAWRVLGWRYPLVPTGALVGVSAVLNGALAFSPFVRRPLRPWEIEAQLSLDVGQFAALLYFTGGVVNPFALLLIAPVTVAGSALTPMRALILCGVSIVATLALALAVGSPVADFPFGAAAYRAGCTIALLVASVLAGGYATWASVEDTRRELALRVAETVLAREQRLSALGALSAAVAHELGTPLATIAIIATEMAREAPEGSLRDDAVLMVEQARRCRDILRRLAETPEQPDALHERMTLMQVVREIVEPYAGAADVRVEALVTGPPGAAAPDLWRRPEILHAISAFLENAYDFARREVLVTARFDASNISIEVRDDGPGFDAAILPKLGEPYVTSRPGAEGSRTGHVGMGLGLFIAKTLLERSGARVSFANGAGRGAIVTARWPRSRMEIAA